MKPRYETTILLSSPRGSPEFQVTLIEETMTLELHGGGERDDRLVPDALREQDACELQTIATRREYAKKLVRFMYKGIRTSQEVKDSEVDRIADILKILINTALPDR